MRVAEPETQPVRDFTALVREHQSMVFGIALNFLRDRQAAEEVAQDVFIQLHRNLDSLQSSEHVTFWLRRVTSNRCIDYARRARRTLVSLDDVQELAAVTPSVDPMLSRRVRRLIASLPEQPRIVMILRYQEDLTPAEIALTLSMPVATVKSHLQRSLSLLREKFARVMGDAQI
jgi:RNA polymerase sigma-70 factor, ECF subfamily